MSGGTSVIGDGGGAKSVRSIEEKPRPDWYSLLQRVEREIVETLDLDSVLSLAVDTAIQVTGARDAAIALHEPPDLLRIVHCKGDYYRNGIFSLRFHDGIVGRALRSRLPLFVENVKADPDYVAFIPETFSEMTLPLVWRGDLLGVLTVETPEPNLFTKEAFDFLRRFTERVSLAVDNAHSHQIMQQQVDEMRDLYERVRALERMKSTLIDIAAHDLRNPIGAIRNLTEMVLREEDMPSERRHEMLTAVLSSSSEAMRIIEDLLILQRIENGGKDATFRALDMKAVVRAVVERKAPGALLFEQELQTVLADVPLIVLGEPALLREALSNLLDNAIKYTPANGQITVSLKAQEDTVIFAVKDTGYGIPSDEQKLIFDPFYRSPIGISRGILGTGLGLHIVKQVVEQHGGHIGVTSTLNEGSTFTVTLPRLPIHEDE